MNRLCGWTAVIRRTAKVILFLSPGNYGPVRRPRVLLLLLLGLRCSITRTFLSERWSAAWSTHTHQRPPPLECAELDSVNTFYPSQWPAEIHETALWTRAAAGSPLSERTSQSYVYFNRCNSPAEREKPRRIQTNASRFLTECAAGSLVLQCGEFTRHKKTKQKKQTRFCTAANLQARAVINRQPSAVSI